MPENDPIDELVRQSISHAPGAVPGLAGRVRLRAQSESATRRKARLAWVRAAVSVAAAAAVIAFVVLYVDFTPPAKPETASGNEAPKPASNRAPAPMPANQPRKPVPETAPEAPEGLPEQDTPAPQPEPESQPEPEPQPQPKGEVVEKPQPETEPKPEAPPAQPPTEAPKAAERVVLAVVPPGARVNVMQGGNWREAKEGDEIAGGTPLQARRGYVDLQLGGGELLRFDGQITPSLHEGALLIELAEKSLYADNLGLSRRLLVRCNGIEGACAGASVFTAVRGGMKAACLEGEVRIDGEAVQRGTERRATDRGVRVASEYKPDALVTGAPARVIARYEMDGNTDLYNEGERLEDGVAVSDSKPWYIGFRHAPTLAVLPGMRVRMRWRCTGADRIDLEQFLADDTLFKVVFKPEKDGAWLVSEFKISELPARDNAGRRLQPGELLRNFKLHHNGTRLELDWVEFVRVQD